MKLEPFTCAAALLLAACAAPAVRAGVDTRVMPGVWGGEHIALTVKDDGAHAEFDCASAEIAAPLVADDRGNFAADAAFTAERGGPVRSDQPPEAKAARFSGRVVNRTMTLDVVLVDANEKVGSFALELGREPVVRKCR